MNTGTQAAAFNMKLSAYVPVDVLSDPAANDPSEPNENNTIRFRLERRPRRSAPNSESAVVISVNTAEYPNASTLYHDVFLW